MTALALLALSPPGLRFVYVDPTGHVRLYGSPGVRSVRGHARRPDLSPDGRRFVYWVATDSPSDAEPMVEHEIATGKERVLRRGNLRSPRYAADGRTIYFTQTIGDAWCLLALDRTTGKARIVHGPASPENGKIEYAGPVPMLDGTLAVYDMGRLFRLDASGRVLRTRTIRLPSEADGAEPDFHAPAPGRPDRVLLSNLTTDANPRIVGTDGMAGGLWVYGGSAPEGHRIIGRAFYAQAPCWMPDGKAILFQGDPLKGRSGIWSIRPDGTGLRFLVPGEEPSAGI